MSPKRFSISSVSSASWEDTNKRTGGGRRLSDSSGNSSDDSKSTPMSSASSVTTVHSGTLRASLPSSWYTSENFFALEARAIFSQVPSPLFCIHCLPCVLQAWHCVTHSNRFKEEGTYYRFNIGTYPIFLILSKDGVIRGFHNICRHRGFRVVSM